MKDAPPITAIFDCNVLIQAAANRNNPASACFRLVEADFVQLFVSESTLLELNNVLHRDYIKECFRYTDEVISEFISRLLISATVLSVVPEMFSLPRDVDDEQYINLAIEANAQYLVTLDNDLLDLMTDFDVAGKEFRQKTRPLRIVKPLDFLRIVEELTRRDLSIAP